MPLVASNARSRTFTRYRSHNIGCSGRSAARPAAEPERYADLHPLLAMSKGGRMNTGLKVIGTLFLVASAACEPARSAPGALPAAALRDSVTARIQSLTSAAAARDANRFLAYFDSSASFRWVVQGEVIDFAQLAADYRRGWARQKREWNVTVDSMWLEVVAADAVVATWSGYTTSIAMDGKIGSAAYVATVLWRRTPAGWFIVSGHESFPR